MQCHKCRIEINDEELYNCDVEASFTTQDLIEITVTCCACHKEHFILLDPEELESIDND